MKTFSAILMGIIGIISMVGSALVMKFWAITIIVLSILKLTSVLNIPWFAGITSLGAISTGLWMLFGGLIVMILSYIITIISGLIIKKR